MNFSQSTLENGLRVASEPLVGAGTVALAMCVGVGARYEGTGEEGLSHLLEHMAYKGTESKNAKQIAEAFDDLGAAFNAYTSLEHTVYYVRVLKEHTDAAMALLADILQHPTFDAEELKREQQVIVQEIGMHNDSPEDLVFDHLFQEAFGKQPLGKSILGTPEQVQSYAPAHVRSYMQKHYQTGGMVLAAAGALSHADIERLANKHFVNLHTGSAPECTKAEFKGGMRYTQEEFEQMHVMLGVPALTFHDKDYMAQQLLSLIFGGGGSSLLFQEVREKHGLAYSVYSFTSSFADVGLFGIYAACAPEKAGKLMEVLAEQWRALLNALDNTQLHRAKQQQKSSLLMTGEGSAALAEWIGRHLLDYGRYKSAEELAAEVDAVTLEDLKRVATRILGAKNLALAALGPVEHMPKKDAAKALFMSA